MALTEIEEIAIEREKSKGHLRRAMERLVRKKLAVVCMITLLVARKFGGDLNLAVCRSGLKLPN